MDALTGRHQTTRGIWLARSPKVAAPTTLVMDLEGSDGRERGEDDTSFERQSALFALAVADVVLVNMWAKDVGRESGAGKPLLKTIFQVNLKLFQVGVHASPAGTGAPARCHPKLAVARCCWRASVRLLRPLRALPTSPPRPPLQPAPGRRRTVLLFVFRDRTKTPLERLVETWEADLARMWAGITKPPQYEDASLADFFDLRYAALSNYEDRQEEFLAETVLLRRQFADGDDAGACRTVPCLQCLHPAGKVEAGHRAAPSRQALTLLAAGAAARCAAVGTLPAGRATARSCRRGGQLPACQRREAAGPRAGLVHGQGVGGGARAQRPQLAGAPGEAHSALKRYRRRARSPLRSRTGALQAARLCGLCL